MDGRDQHKLEVYRYCRLTEILVAVDSKPLLQELSFVIPIGNRGRFRDNNEVSTDRKDCCNSREDVAKAILYHTSKSCKNLLSVKFKNEDGGDWWKLSQSGILQLLEEMPSLEELVIHDSTRLDGELYFPAQLKTLACPMKEDLLEAITQACECLESIAFSFPDVVVINRRRDGYNSDQRQLLDPGFGELNFFLHEDMVKEGPDMLAKAFDNFMEKFHPKLRSIQLSKVRMSETSMQFISNCSQLTYLSMSESNCSFAKSLDLSKLAKLEKLILHSCLGLTMLSCGPDPLNCLKHLDLFDILGMTDPDWIRLIRKWPNLERFHVKSVDGVGNDTLLALRNCPSLKRLEIYRQNNVTSKGLLRAIPTLSKLEQLTVKDCRQLKHNTLQEIHGILSNLEICNDFGTIIDFTCDDPSQAVNPTLPRLGGQNVGGESFGHFFL